MPFDPRLSTDALLREEFEPQIRAADQADKAAAREAAAMAREAEQAQKEQARAAEDADKQAQVANNLASETAFKQSNRPYYKDEAGVIVPEEDDDAYAASQQAQAAKAAKITQYQLEGRRYRPNPVDDSITVLDSDAVLEQRKKDAADKLRKEAFDQRLKALDAEVDYKTTTEKLTPLSETGVTNLKKQLAGAQSDATYALTSKLTPKSQETDKVGFWDVMNNNPTPEATAATTRLQRLSAPNAELDDQDLADLEADETTAPTAQKIRTIKTLLGKHDAASQYQQTAAEKRADLILRRDAPEKWAEAQRLKIQSMDVGQLDKHLQDSDTDLTTKQSDLESRYQKINAPLEASQTERKALTLKNEQALKSGVPAGELVTMQDGTQWHKPLAAQLFDLQAKSETYAADNEPARQQLVAEAEDLKVEVALRNDAAKRAQDLQKTAKGDVDAVQSFMPGMERASAQSRSIQADFEARAADLADMYPEDSPQRQAAVEALQAETQTKLEQSNAVGVQTHAAAQAAYQGYKQQLAEDPKLNAKAGELFVTARKNLAQALGIDEKEADRILNDVESHDWSSRQGKHGEDMEGPGSGTGASAFINEARGDKRQFRMLSNGGVIINPMITDPAAYKAAVDRSPASPEAKRAAMAVQPNLRENYGKQSLDTLEKLQDEGWQKFQATQPKDVPLEEQAARYADTLKETATPVGKITRQLLQSMAQGVDDIGAQALGVVAGITGSETAMAGAQALNERSQLIELDKQIHGATDSFMLRASGQFARLAPSLIPAAGGAKVAQVGLGLFARTAVGTRMLPALSAAIRGASTPAQAAKATANIVQAGVAGSAVAGGLQTYGATIADVYTTLREKHPEMSHATALRQAQMPAILSGAVTAILTTIGGATGVEKLLANPAAIKEVFKKQFTSQLSRAGYVAKQVALGGIKEWPEEIADEVFSTVATAAASGESVPQALAQFVESLPELSAAIFALGGAGEGIQAIRESSRAPRDATQPNVAQVAPVEPADPALRPEVAAAAWSSIDQLSNREDLNPADIPGMQERASVALAVAQGGSVEDLEETQLNAAGWTGRNSKGVTLPEGQIERLKGYTGPEVLEVDSAGAVTVSPAYRASLAQNLPEVAAAIPANHGVKITASTNPPAAPEAPIAQPSGTSQPAISKRGLEKAAQEKLRMLREKRDGEIELDKDGKPQQVTIGATLSPTEEKTLKLLEDALESGPEADVEALASAFGYSLKETTVVSDKPETQVTAEGQRIRDFTTHFQDLGLAPAEAAQVAQYLVNKQGVIGETYVDQAITKDYPKILRELGLSGSLSTSRAQDNPLRVPADFSQRLASQTAAKTAPLSPVAGPSTSQAPESSEVQPARGSSVQGAASPARVAPPAAAAPATSNQETVYKKAQPSTTAPKLSFPQQERAEQLAAKIVKDGSYTEEEAAALAAEFVAQSSENDSDLNKQYKLSFLPWLSRAETAARGGSLAKGKVNAAGEPVADTDVVPETPSRPSDLRRNSAWSRARLQALTSLPASKRPQARKTLNILERALAENHALFGTLALGDSAKSLLGGSALAVNVIDGQTVLALDLSNVLQELSNLTDAEAGITATMVEETIHAAVLTLAKQNPGKYGMGELVKRWNSLTPELRQKVWESYHAIDILNKTQPSQMPGDMRAGQQWQLYNEFLRMMIQDRKFAGQVSEAAAQDKSLAQWLMDMLKDLRNALRDLVSKASPEVQADLETMIEEVGNLVLEMQARSKGDPSRLATLPALKPMAKKTPVASVKSKGGKTSPNDESADLNAPSVDAPPTDMRPLEVIFPGAALGTSITVTAPNGQKVRLRPAVVEANSPATIASMNFAGQSRTDFPQVFQPRKTDGVAISAQKRKQIATNADFSRLSSTAGGIRDGAAKVSRNHHVIIGNHRDVAIDHAYANPSDFPNILQYEKDLRAQAASFGISNEALQKIQKPKLIYIIEEDVNLRKLAEMGNAEMGPVDQAYQDAAALSPGLALINATEDGSLPGSSNMNFFRWFERNLVHDDSQKERFFDDDGGLGADGMERIQRALLAYAYGKDKQARAMIDTMVGSVEEENRNLSRVLSSIAPALADMKARMNEGDLFDMDISADVAWASYYFAKARKAGKPVSTYLEPGLVNEAGYTPPTSIQASILRFLDENARSAKNMIESFARYNGAVLSLGDPKQQSLFGDEPRPTREELFALATGQTSSQETAQPRLASGTKTPTLPPATALKLYRTLSAKQTLTPGQSKALETAEMSLGQTFLFGDATNRIAKPAEDLRLETQTTGQARQAEQLNLFSGSKRVVPEWIKPVESLTIDATLARYGIQTSNSFRNPRIARAQLQGLPVTGGRESSDSGNARPRSEGGSGSGSRGAGIYSASQRGLEALPKLDLGAWGQHVRQIPEEDLLKGQEHTVYRHRDPRGDTAIKLTNAGEFGARGSLGGYLEQMARQNEMFGDDIAIEGWIQFPGESGPRLVTSQRWQRGRPSTLEEIDGYMRRKGFQRAYEGAWWDGSTVVSDALPKNFITATDGSVYPIDLIIETPRSQNRIDQLDNQVASQAQPQPTPEPPALYSGSKATDPRLLKQFGADWPHGWNEYGFPNMPKTLPADDNLLKPTETKTSATLRIDHPLVVAGILPADRSIPRAAFQRAVVQYFMQRATPVPAGTQPTLYAMGGGGGAGKSTILGILKKRGTVNTDNTVEINADDIKELIPEYHELKLAGDGRAAATVHEESSQITALLMDRAIPAGKPARYNIVFDGTLANAEKTKVLFKRWKASGLNIHLIGVSIDPREAITRAVLRGQNSGRWVPVDVLMDAHRSFNAAVPAYIPLVDLADVYDNTPPKPYAIVEKTAPGPQFSIVNPQLWGILESRSNEEISTNNSRRNSAAERDTNGPRQTPFREVQRSAAGEEIAPDWPQMLAQVNDMTVQEFAALAATGKLNQATGKPSPFPVGSMNTPLAIGAAEGYPLQDIAHFYLARRTPRDTTPADLADSAPDAADVSEIVTAFDEFANDGYRESQATGPQTVMPDGAILTGPGMQSLHKGTVYHGTPHQVDEFSLDKINTGAGEQAYGWGLYFARSREVANQYRSGTPAWTPNTSIKNYKLNEAVKKLHAKYYPSWGGQFKTRENGVPSTMGINMLVDWSRSASDETKQVLRAQIPTDLLAEIDQLDELQTGNLYTVDLLPDEDEFLDWDKPMSEQSEKVKAALRQLWNDAQLGSFTYTIGVVPKRKNTAELIVRAVNTGDEMYSGSKVYDLMSERLGAKAASEKLASLGIPGIKYLDGNSRAGGTGTSNYVIFDAKLVKILEENGKPRQTPALQKGRTAPDDTPDLFSFNSGLGLDTLLTPAQNEAKTQQAQTFNLFGDFTNDGPRTNTSVKRPAKARQPSQPAADSTESEGAESLFGDLFSQRDDGQRVSATRLPRKRGTDDKRTGSGDIGDGVSGPTDQGTKDKPADSLQGDPPRLSLAPAVIPTPADPADRNHRISGSGTVAPKGGKAKLEANFAAMKLVRELDAAGRNPTPEEKQTLAAYTGWGWMKEAFNTVRARKYDDLKRTAEKYIANKPTYDSRRFNTWRDFYATGSVNEESQRILNWADTYLETHERLKSELSEKEFHAAEKSTLNAHFTTPSIIDAMWKAVAKLGFKGGRAMEPGGGIGHFIGVQPEDIANRTQWEATELDDVTARILARLYPQARVNSAMSSPNREVSGMGFQNARIPNNSLDLFISNVPFAKTGPGKAKSEFGQDFNLHNYFFARALSKVKPGGLIAFITTSNTMEASRSQRDYLNNHGQLVAAVRLPNNAFKENAGTEVTTDILILRKPDNSDFVGEPWRERVKVGEDTVTSKRGKIGNSLSQKMEDWLGDIDPEWVPADEALVEPFQAWMKGGRPASGQKRTALMNALQRVHGYNVQRLDFRAPIYVNEYFARHPENVLGNNRLIGSMYSPGEYTVTPKDESLDTQLDEFVDRLPADIMSQSETNDFAAQAAERGDKVDSYVERDGRIYQVTKEGLEPVEWQVMPGMDAKAKAAAERKTAIFRQWAKLRDAAVTLVKLEANPLADEGEMKTARALLNQVYDRTVEKYNALSKRRNNNYRFLEDDPEAALLAALEDEERSTDKDGKVTYTYTKTDIFRRRLIEPQEAPTTAANLEEAVSISMAWEGTVNPQYVADLLGTDAGLARQQLIEGGHAFEDPTSGLLMTADEYLSGPVSERLRLAQEAVKDSPQYERNVTALREALPPNKAISEASVILGQRWVPDSIYTAFARSLGIDAGTVEFSRELNSFAVRGEGSNEEWNVGNQGAKEILDAVVNNTTLVYRRYERGEGMKVDEELTATLRVKADEMRDAFSTFVKTTEEQVTDPEFEGQTIAIPDLAEREFNQKVNGIKPPNYVGDWVKLPGQSGIIWLKPFRKAVLARLITQGRGMMAHGVGSGKTYNQIALAMELRRLGKARKPVIVVQNSTINQFAASFRKAYPQAKILVATPRSYNAKSRARFTARMATGDWDAIIMTHSNIDLIGHSAETVSAYFAKELEELDAAIMGSDGSDQQSDLQKARDSLIEKRDEMMQALGERQDDTLNWEDIGVDALIVDEAHAFKNAPVVTNRGREIKNIPSSGVGSQRAVSMMMKTRSVRERNNQRGVFFATGTPVSNSMAEAFIMLRYIAPDMLEANGIRNFDDFASQYGDVVSQAESTWDGKVKMVDRFAKFVNGQQLINLVRSVFDVAMGNESLGIDVPTVKGGKPRQVVVGATPANIAFNNWILRAVAPSWEAITRKDIKENPKLSAVPIMTMQAGIAAALDPRLIHDNAPDDPNSKVNTAIREVLRTYKAGTARKTAQVIFSDLFNSFNMDILQGFAGHPFAEYGENPIRKNGKLRDDGTLPRGNFNLGADIKAKLIAAGVPEKEIMVVTDQKDEALTTIFDKVNDGDIRVIIGSTGRLGVGVNIQERLAAVHHLMPPRDFKPAMMEQRNGRIIRQGNLHAEWRDIAFADTVESSGKTRLPTKDEKGKTLSPSKRAAAAKTWLAENDKDGSIKTAAETAAREFDIEITEYGVEKSLDSAVYSMMAAKQGMIAQVLTSDAVGNEFEDPSDEIRMNMAEMAAHTMGDPDMIRTVTVDKLFRELRAAYDGFQRMDSSRRADVRRLTFNVSSDTATLGRIDSEAARYGKLWEANEGKPVYAFGGTTIDTSEKDAKITKPLDLWVSENAGDMALKGQQERTAKFTVNGQEFNLTVKGETEPTEFNDGGVYGFVEIAKSDRYANFQGGARGVIQALHRLTESAATRPAETRASIAKDSKKLAQIESFLAKEQGFPRMDELQAIMRERQELMQRINARNAPPPAPANDNTVRQKPVIPSAVEAEPLQRFEARGRSVYEIATNQQYGPFQASDVAARLLAAELNERQGSQSSAPSLAKGRTAPLLSSSKNMAGLQAAKNAWTAGGFNSEQADNIIEQFYRPEAFSSIPKNAVLVPMPSTSGKNVLPFRLAQRLAQSGATIASGNYAVPTAQREAKAKTTFWAKMSDPVEYQPDADLNDLRQVTGRPIWLVEDIHNTGESWLAMRAMLEKEGIPVAGVATLAASDLRQTSERDIERLSQKVSMLLTKPLEEVQPVMYGLFNDSYKQWFNKAERAIDGSADQAKRLFELARARTDATSGQSQAYSAGKRALPKNGFKDPLSDSYIQGYLNLPNVNVPANKQPAAKRAIRAAANASTQAYQLPSAAGNVRDSGRLDKLRERAEREWRGLVSQNVGAIREAFQEKNTLSTILQEFTSRQIPSFDIRGAVIKTAADFAAFNVAVRTPYFETLKIAVVDDSNQVVHSQIVHVGSLNETIADPKSIAGVLASAKLANPKTKLAGWLIAHNHPSGDPTPSDADNRITRTFREMGLIYGLPLIDHVVTNGERYYSYRESGFINGQGPSGKTKPTLPILPTPAQPEMGNLADWEVLPTGRSNATFYGNNPLAVIPYLATLRTADPDHLHVLFVDTRLAVRAVERIPASSTNAEVAQRIIFGAAREGAYGFLVGFPQNNGQDNGISDEQNRLVRHLKEMGKSSGLRFVDAVITFTDRSMSFVEMGLMEQPVSSLAKGQTAPIVGNDAEANQLDSRTAGQSFIRGSRVTAEQGRSIRDVHFARVAEDGPLRQGSASARSGFDWTPGAGLAQRLGAAFGAPVITAAQEADIQALEANTDGVESIVYLDRDNGVIYKRLQDGRGNPAGGIWPHVGHTSQKRLDWSFQQAKNPRAIGVRLAVMSDFGGTPTEIAAIGPKGHIYLKQPLSPNPGIGSQDDFINKSGNAATRRASGIMEIPTNLITYNAPRAYITVVKGRPWLVLDLHADNLVGDNQGAGRINDPVIGIITQDTLKNVKGLGAVVQQTTQEVQQLGDRSARLFAGTKRVNTSQDSEYLAAVEAGDMAKAQAMVDAAAKAAGFRTTKYQHTSANRDFTEFRVPAWFEPVSSKYYREGFSRNSKVELQTRVFFIQLKKPKSSDYDAISEEPYDTYGDVTAEGYNNRITDSPQVKEFEAQYDGWETSDGAVIAVISPNQIKSAEPVTRDESGQVIPLSKRFNPESESILYKGSVATSLDAAAQTAATSPMNSTPEPSAAQKKAGNYKVGRFNLGPLDISIENPAGSVRSGTDPDGTKWSTRLHDHYGYIRGTQGKDGDHIDIYIQPGTPADYNGPVFVVNQMDTAGQFDEHKVVLGVDIRDAVAARSEYLKNYTLGWKGAGSIAEFPSVAAFEEWATERRRMGLAKGTTTPSPLAALGWNHLDRHVSAKMAALTRHLDDKVGVSETVAKWQGAEDAKPFLAALKAVKGQFMPDSILPREVAAAKREMEIKTAIGSQKAMDLVRALSGNPKFSDLVYPAEFSANPVWRKKMYLAMTGEAPLSGLPAELQALAQRLRDMLIEQGTEAVKQGRMSLETFENLREGYMPHYYKEDVQREKSLTKRFRLGLRDITAQRTTAWHISDRENKDAGGEPRLVNWQGNQWRFRNQGQRDAFYEDFILKNVLDTLQMRGGQNKKLTLADLRAPAKLPEELRGRIKELTRAQRYRFQKMAPLSVQEKEDAGLIMDPVYSISRYMAQMVHDNSTAAFFNFVASKPEWISDVQVADFTEIPDNARFGRLAGKFVQDDIAGQLLEMIESPNTALRLYDTLMGWWKTGKTVLNPGTHVRNVLGNIFFSQLAGASVWNPGNLTYYRQALSALRDGGRTLQEAYENGVLGADFVSAELRQTLRQILPDPATIQDDGKPDALLGIGKALGKLVPEWAKNPLSKSYNHIANAYQAEDEVFKLAAYLKAQSMGLTPEESAAHVRQWFPYFDGGTSGTLKLLGRTAMPFLGFYRESIRIFGNALKERPIALAAGLSVPSLVTFLSALALGLDDDDLEELKKDMRGKAGKLLGPTPLEGMPLFSMLLPVRSDQGQIQQFDISAVHPFVDFLGNRVEGGDGEDWWQKTLRSLVAAGPIGSLLYAQMTGKDAFGNRTFVENNMTAGEKIAARVDNAAKTVFPPLVPGGTGFQTLLNAGTRSTGKTLETRSPTQAVARAVVGLDVRNAVPDLYRIADDWRKANKLPTTEGMDFGSTTPTSRARSALFSQLAQDTPNLTAIANLKKKLMEFGAPIQNGQDVQRLLFYKNPLMIISGKENQQRFRASLTGPARAELDRAMSEYQKIKSRSQLLLRQ